MTIRSLESDVEGEIVERDGVLVIARIRVRYELDAAGDEAVIERVHGLHAEKCPVAQTLTPCVEIETELARL